MLKIRVETIDGDVDYYSVDQRLTYLDYLGHLCICICALHRSYYPDYRLADIQATFVFSEELI